MEKALFLFFALLLSNMIFGQQASTEDGLNKSKTQISLAIENQNAQTVIVIDSESYRIKSLKDLSIDPNWIESLTVLTDEVSKKIYGSRNAVNMIYIKKKFEKRVLRKIEKEKRQLAQTNNQ